MLRIFLRTGMLNIWYDYKLTLLEKGLMMINIRISRGKMDFVFIQDLHALYYIVQIFCIMSCIMYYDFIIPIVLQVSDVAHGLLVFIANHINSNSKIEVLYCYKKNFNVFMKVFFNYNVRNTKRTNVCIYIWSFDSSPQDHKMFWGHQIVPFLIKVPIEWKGKIHL